MRLDLSRRFTGFQLRILAIFSHVFCKRSAHTLVWIYSLLNTSLAPYLAYAFFGGPASTYQVSHAGGYMIFANSINLGFGISSCKAFIHRVVTQAKDGSFAIPLGAIQQRRVPFLLQRLSYRLTCNLQSNIYLYNHSTLSAIKRELIELVEALISNRSSIGRLALVVNQSSYHVFASPRFIIFRSMTFCSLA